MCQLLVSRANWGFLAHPVVFNISVLSPTPQAFLAPYHLNIFEGSTVSADHTKGDIANKRAGKAAANVLLACTDQAR